MSKRVKSIIDFSAISDTDRMVIFTSKAPKHLVGKKLPILGEPLFCKYTDKINLRTLEIVREGEDGYDTFQGKELNELCTAGILEDWDPYIQKDIDDILPAIWAFEGNPFTPIYDIAEIDTDALVKNLIAKCKDLGFNVTSDAIRHQLDSWINDYKSGYRDEENGYHLFTPCGHNPFSIRITQLHPLCSWQVTYGI